MFCNKKWLPITFYNLYRFSQPIKDSHQWAPPACSLRHHRAPALTVWQRATLRQSKLTRCQHPSGVHHIRDPGAGAAVSIVYKIWWLPLGPVFSYFGCLLVLLFCALWTLFAWFLMSFSNLLPFLLSQILFQGINLHSIDWMHGFAV